ncbi:MAG: universal stress protein [Candidatus Methanomethylicia archaeon]|nr:universal stress protein [Candidatus Methanomethylicia archaeon]
MAPPPEESVSTIVVGVDGSKPSEAALESAIEMAKKTVSRLLIIYVCPLPAMPLVKGFPGYPHVMTSLPDLEPKVPQQIIDKVSPILKEYESRARKADIKDVEAKIIPVWGSVGSGLVKAAEKEKCAMIVVGSRGLTGIKRTLLGSVADYVVKNASCDVYVVRR